MRSTAFIRSRAREVTILAFVFVLIGISIACTASKSSGSPNPNSNAPASEPPQTTNTMSQEKPSACTLTLAGAPVLNGLRLGLTKAEVLAAFPGAKDNDEVKASLARPPNNIGTSDLLIYPEKYESKANFAGINRITVGFLDGKLYTLNLGYHGPEYPDVDKFVASFVEGKSLPPVDQWEAYPGLDTQMKSLKCNGFELQVYAGGPGGSQNFVQLKDLEAEKLIKDRRAKARAQATPTPDK